MSLAGAAVRIIDTSNRSHWPACRSSAERRDPARNRRADFVLVEILWAA